MDKTTPADTGGQLDLTGGESPLSPGRRVQPPLFDTSGLDRRPPASAEPKRYHSPGWKGTVTESELSWPMHYQTRED